MMHLRRALPVYPQDHGITLVRTIQCIKKEACLLFGCTQGVHCLYKLLICIVERRNKYVKI